MAKKKQNEKTLSIVGLGPTMKEYINQYTLKLGKPTDEAWTINRGGIILRDIDLIVAMDDRRWIETHPLFHGTASAVDKIGVPTLTSRVYPEFHNLVEFPLDEAEKEFPPPPNLFTNSTCYALMYAYMNGFKHIDLYGYEFFLGEDEDIPTDPWWRKYYDEINFRRMKEPGYEGVIYLIATLRERGIEIRWPKTSTLLDADRPQFYYGYVDIVEKVEIV